MAIYGIGSMSGSSLDGLDIALCAFIEQENMISGDIVAAQTIPYDEEWRKVLAASPYCSGWELMKLDAEFGKFIGRQIKNWNTSQFPNAEFIASHGHTVFHEPAQGFTLQIGSGAHIAFETRMDTVTLFRNADIAAGGQGAPFAPIADRTLFPGFACYLNLGGIANVTMQAANGQWKAWDIGPCNQALNFLAAKTGQPFDKDGIIASGGVIRDDMVERLKAMFPFQDGRPKGLSNAEVTSSWIQFLESSKESIPDLLATVTEAIAQMILAHILPFIPNPVKVFVTGGGAHNLFLMHRLQQLSPNAGIDFHLPDPMIIDYKECLLIAYLGYLTRAGRVYGVSDVTGASRDTVGGAVFKVSR